jgi:hypothetical protein
LGRPRLTPLAPMLVLIAVYSVTWYVNMSQQVRFLLPITPLFAILAAAGAVWLWKATSGLSRAAVIAIGLALALPQAAFVGIYSIVRLPVAVGLVDRATYLNSTPTMNDNFYLSCRWVHDHLGADERVLGLIVPYSYYCPQTRMAIAPAVEPGDADYWLHGRVLPPLDGPALAQALRRNNFRFIIVETSREYRLGPAETEQTAHRDLSQDRVGRVIVPILAQVTPEFTDRQSAVYDAEKIAAVLNSQPSGDTAIDAPSREGAMPH